MCQRCGCPLKKGGDKEGKKTAHIHHVIAKRDGGLNDEDNLLSTCWPCERRFHREEIENDQS